jgi:predicted hydrocarbon binding protein
MTATLCQHGVIGIGAGALHALRATTIQDLGFDEGAARLQAVGYAAGEELYASFQTWLPSHTDVSDPLALDADTLTDVLTAFFQAAGWGTVTVARLGTRALAVTSTDWVEAHSGVDGGPSCFISTGVLASFFTAMAGGTALAVMELECMAQGGTQCRFLIGAPETLTAVYDAASRNQPYDAILGA